MNRQIEGKEGAGKAAGKQGMMDNMCRKKNKH